MHSTSKILRCICTQVFNIQTEVCIMARKHLKAISWLCSFYFNDTMEFQITKHNKLYQPSVCLTGITMEATERHVASFTECEVQNKAVKQHIKCKEFFFLPRAGNSLNTIKINKNDLPSQQAWKYWRYFLFLLILH